MGCSLYSHFLRYRNICDRLSAHKCIVEPSETTIKNLHDDCESVLLQKKKLPLLGKDAFFYVHDFKKIVWLKG